MLSRFITSAGFAGVAVYLLTACSRQRSAPVEGAADVPAAGPKAEQIWFEEVAAKAGIQFHYQSGHRPGQFYIPEIMGRRRAAGLRQRRLAGCLLRPGRFALSGCQTETGQQALQEPRRLAIRRYYRQGACSRSR